MLQARRSCLGIPWEDPVAQSSKRSLGNFLYGKLRERSSKWQTHGRFLGIHWRTHEARLIKQCVGKFSFGKLGERLSKWQTCRSSGEYLGELPWCDRAGCLRKSFYMASGVNDRAGRLTVGLWEYPGDSHGPIAQAVSAKILKWQVASTIERMADPREFSGNILGSSRGALSKPSLRIILYCKWLEPRKLFGKPLRSSCGVIKQAVRGNLFKLQMASDDQANWSSTLAFWQYTGEVPWCGRATGSLQSF